MKIVEISPEATVKGTPPSFRFLVAVSGYNTLITDRLLEGALETFRSMGPVVAEVTVVRVPGALELPFVARKAAESGRYDGVLALGCVIRGETGHYDVVVSGVTDGLGKVNALGRLPVVFGILTTETLLQALDRVGGKAGHKGVEGASTLLTMARIARALDAGNGPEESLRP